VRVHTRIARYSFTGDAQEIARRVEEEFLPIFQSMPGFKMFTSIDAGDEIFSLSVWDTAEQAQAAQAASAQWNADNIADRAELKEVIFGELVIATAFGVSTLAGARA
jgi:heme-degrading monooxygenase HmoA